MTATTSRDIAGTPPVPDRRRQLLDWIGLAARLVLGGVLVWAGAVKLPDLRESVLAVQAYKILPFDVATVVGYALPIAEVALGLLLILGLLRRRRRDRVAGGPGEVPLGDRAGRRPVPQWRLARLAPPHALRGRRVALPPRHR